MSKDFDNKWKVFIEQEIPELDEESPKPSDEEIQKAKDLLKDLLVVVAATTAPEVNEGRGGFVRRQRKRTRAKTTKEIKKIAGLTGISLKDFTPEQRVLFDQAKKELTAKNQNEKDQFYFQAFNGNALDIPIVKQQLDKGGQPLKLALTSLFSAAGMADCIDNLNVRCLLLSLNKMSQGM
jgi:hypothetical protein